MRPLKTGLPSKNFFATLYTEFSDRTALAPNLAKILLVAERKGGKISTRDAQLAFNQKLRPSSQVMRSWFSELALLGYGKIEKSKGGKTWIFENISRSDDQLDQLPSNVMFASITATDLPSISCDQLDQLKLATDPTDRQLIHEVITSKPLQGEGLGATDPTDHLIDRLSEKIENQNVSDCIKFIRTAISDNDPQAAKDIQAILAEQTPEEKQQIWDALSAEEKSAFRCLISKSSTNTPQTPTNKELKGVDESGSDDDQMDQLKAAQELILIEKELLAISNLEDFSDFADWLEDPQYLKNLCLSLGDQPEKLWLAHQIQNLLNFEDKATAVEVIADFRDRFSKEILEAAGKLAVAGFYKIGARALLKCPK